MMKTMNDASLILSQWCKWMPSSPLNLNMKYLNQKINFVTIRTKEKAELKTTQKTRQIIVINVC